MGNRQVPAADEPARRADDPPGPPTRAGPTTVPSLECA